MTAEVETVEVVNGVCPCCGRDIKTWQADYLVVCCWCFVTVPDIHERPLVPVPEFNRLLSEFKGKK